MVARLFNAEDLIKETIKAAEAIAQFSKPAVMVAREAVDQALELTLNEGLLYERRVFHSLFATQDQKEGMAAFLEKRQPDFKGM